MTQQFEGFLYPPRSSHRTAVHLQVGEEGDILVLGEDGNVLLQALWRELKLSQRVGGSARRLTFSDGAVVETSDNDAVDSIDREHRGTSVASLMHRMERLTPFTLVVLAVTLAVAFSFFKWWLPAASDRMAMTLPPSLLDSIGNQTLKIMDKGFLEPSTLAASDREKFEAQFQRLLGTVPELGQTSTLLFRSAPTLGPNAFALPNGNIVLTDEIIALATNDLQVVGVLAHEISHVENRHIMRSFLRSTSVAVIIVLITGDMAELTEMAIAIPTFMMEMGYSRDFEREADARAVDLMTAIGEDPAHLADMFELMAKNCDEEDCGNTWLSSHPDTRARIASIRGRD